ncbi:unnamed protein product [Triticum turgidum subsp. durum]|uniref:F-box domain-containing protein n=1 Tax=Triticum turgidum subsp. durum TaxID=4567 RepID=A0A9R0XTH7_TRITD|nr:unnamed protein product [Triticum turgidum subsp. durum]
MTSRHRPPPSPAAGPLENDDLLSEILLRLPPQPSSLPRASAVCTRWRSLASDPGFCRRFRIHHRRNLPLLGFFENSLGRSFIPALEAPNRVPPGRFSLQPGDSDPIPFRCIGCRHGLVLVFDLRRLYLVWDPVTGHQHRLACPPGFDPEGSTVNGAVLRAGPDVQHFQVVLVAAGDDDRKQRRVFACVYSSETGGWGNVTSTPIESEVPNVLPIAVDTVPAVLVGRSLYWLLKGSSSSHSPFNAEKQIIEFDLEKQKLAVIRMPGAADVFLGRVTVVQEDGGGLGFLIVKDLTAQAQLWKRKMDSDGVGSWELKRTIDLNKLLSLNLEKHIGIIRFAEDNNLLVLPTVFGLFTVQLQSLQYKKLSGYNKFCHLHPFESVYIAGNSITSMPPHFFIYKTKLFFDN